jgi:hypothetical protein
VRTRLKLALSRGAALCGGLAVLSFSTLAAAADEGTPPSTAGDAALGTHQRHVRLDLGLRVQYVSDEGLDPFAKNDAIAQFSPQASLTLWTHERLSIAGVLGFDVGGRGAPARSDQADLDLRRFVLAPEARYHLFRILALTAKVGPTLTREEVDVRGGLGASFHKVAWKMGADATAGVAVELFGFHSGASRSPRIWFTGEGGYGWTAPMEMVLFPRNAGAVPQRLIPLRLPDLSVAGPLFRFSAALSFW